MTQAQLDEANRLAEELVKIGGEPKVLDICEALLHQSQELERLRECVREAEKLLLISGYILGDIHAKTWLSKYSDLMEGRE